MRIAPLLVLLLALAACQQHGAPPPSNRDYTDLAHKLLADHPLDNARLDTVMGGPERPWLPQVYVAYAHFPSAEESQVTLEHYFTHPEKDSKLDIPELLFILGGMKRGGYTNEAIADFTEVFMQRAFALDAQLFPDPTREEPPGLDIDELLADAYAMGGKTLQSGVSHRLELVFGRNPRAFSSRDPDWLIRLMGGTWGKIELTPETMFGQTCMAAATVRDTKVLPALNAVADDNSAVDSYRCSAAAGALLMSDSPEGNRKFIQRIFGNNDLAHHFSIEAYRLLAARKEPTLYPVIKKALEILPEHQRLDYAEPLARYGKLEDLPTVMGFINSPIDAVDMRFSAIRSPQLLNPLSMDTLLATQSSEAIAMRQNMAKRLGDQAPEQTTPPPGKPDLLPGNIMTDPSNRTEMAKELNIPKAALWSYELTREQVAARRLWWLRFFPIESVQDTLADKLRRGSEEEQLVALRILGLKGTQAQLPSIELGFDSKYDRVQVETAVWYLKWKNAGVKGKGV